jgi:hypothetical protein
VPDKQGVWRPLGMKQGDAVNVREHRFLAATYSIDYTYTRVKGAADVLFGGTGFFIDQNWYPNHRAWPVEFGPKFTVSSPPSHCERDSGVH